ncbi:hypothetical protein P389DRAFT_82866 [Cystobasidium minutum MCA 4210]|uniref:uncharacterized protein n=1 Tax=Cystobasidium minutum MCA 4210 TaxID=1397322 RepID=UPI0034CFD90B|eukprot:jgi/Rhomi1/82866/CE82865_3148
MQSHPRLVVEEERQSRTASSTTGTTSSPASRSSSKDKGKERASSRSTADEGCVSSESSPDDAPSTSLRCLNCACVLLSYPADSTSSSPITPKSKTGQYIIDLSPSSKLVIGAQRIAELSNKEKNPDWSDLYRVIIPVSTALTSSSADDTDDAISSMTRRSPSSDTLNSKKSDSMDETQNDRASTSPTLQRTSSLKRSNSGSTGAAAFGGRSASASQTPFHSAARARIKQNRQEVESKISQLREAFEAESKRYIEQADILASKLKAAERASKRNSSPSAGKRGNAANNGSLVGSDETNSHIVIRGGFDPPKSDDASATSPDPSSHSGSRRTPITSPHLATSTNFPALFSSMSGATLASSSSPATTGESVPTREPPKKDGIVQPTGPQSPTFRRSRSPSPSRDTSRGRNESKDRAGGRDGNAADTVGGSSTMERQASDEHYNTAATTSKRPALNLMRDVSNLETDKQKKGDNNASESEAARGRSAATTAATGTSLPAHSVLRKTAYNANISASYAPRQRGAWLRLNGMSPSPPANRLMLDRDLPESEDKKDEAEASDAKKDGNSNDIPRRASLSKHRHVSFKEPEPGSSVEASPAPVEQALEPEEEDEVPFDMDEDIAHLEDEAEDDEEDGAFVAVEGQGPSTNGSIDASAETSTAPEHVTGSLSKPSSSVSRSMDKKGQAAASLSVILNDPSTFIGSLKSRGYGTASAGVTGRSPADYAVSPDSSKPKDKDRVSLSDQAQRLRELLALDAPSHRSTKSKRDKALASYLRDSTDNPDLDDIPDEELDSVAPVSALATSLPVAIGAPGFSKKKDEHDLERKTSLPQRESMLVPPLRGSSGRGRPSKPGQYSPIDRLPSLGEESESAPGSRSVSPSGVPGPVNRETGDALAAGNDESDEVMDKLAELETKRDFIPPHAWRFRDPVRAVDMLGTSVHDYE